LDICGQPRVFHPCRSSSHYGGACPGQPSRHCAGIDGRDKPHWHQEKRLDGDSLLSAVMAGPWEPAPDLIRGPSVPAVCRNTPGSSARGQGWPPGSSPGAGLQGPAMTMGKGRVSPHRADPDAHGDKPGHDGGGTSCAKMRTASRAEAGFARRGTGRYKPHHP
jgi:hypothetical protein